MEVSISEGTACGIISLSPAGSALTGSTEAAGAAGRICGMEPPLEATFSSGLGSHTG